MDQDQSIAFCENLFAETLDGHRLMTNARHLRGSAWLNFSRLICGNWSTFNGFNHVVLMGDAAHTAHFAIGSGTKLAIDDAIELAKQFRDIGDTPDHIPDVLAAYETVRRIDVARIQNAARNAMEWFEVVGTRYCDQLEPEQFMYSLLTRSQRISHENLRLRDKAWLEGYERWFAARNGVRAEANEVVPPPMFTPYRLRGLTLHNRIVVSPMAMYSAKDGVARRFPYGAFRRPRARRRRARLRRDDLPLARTRGSRPAALACGATNRPRLGGASSLSSMARRQAKVGLQLGHAGRKGSTKVAWEGTDQPLEEGNWPLISASALPYLAHSQVPRAMTREDMDRVRDDFVRATHYAVAIGFDIVELHVAHGYLLSSFLSPLTNLRYRRVWRRP